MRSLVAIIGALHLLAAGLVAVSTAPAAPTPTPSPDVSEPPDKMAPTTVSVSASIGNLRAKPGDQFTVQILSGASVLASGTSEGTGDVIDTGTGSTGTYDASPGTYTLTEIAAGTTDFADYHLRISCTNATRNSNTALPNGPVNLNNPPTVKLKGNDVIDCVIENSSTPSVTIMTSTYGGDATFDYAVTGAVPATASVRTTDGLGSLTLDDTWTDDVIDIVQQADSAWVISSQGCTDFTTGAQIPLPHTLTQHDQIFCSFVNRRALPPPQPCEINPVRNPTFDTDLGSWTATGGWQSNAAKASNTSQGTTFAADALTQTVHGVADGSAIAVDVLARDDAASSDGGNAVMLQVVYDGTPYAAVETTLAVGGDSTVTPMNGATVNLPSIAMGLVRTLTVTLPSGVPRSGDLTFRMERTGTGDASNLDDDLWIDGVTLRTTAICLQKESALGVGTFTFDGANLDTDSSTPADDSTFTATTTAMDTPVTVDPVFGVPGAELVVPNPGVTVSFTETGPGGWAVSDATCSDAFTGDIVSVDVTGATVTVDGTVIPPRTVLNCLVTDAPSDLTITVPGPVDLGTVAPGGTVTGHLGQVTVDNPAGYPTWTSEVQATAFSNGVTTIPRVSISYWSGPATAAAGLGTHTPGQPTSAEAVTLAAPRTAFSAATVTGPDTVSWDPTISIAIPLSGTAGAYSGSIVHSVA
jgi:hypothetical protein